MEGLLFTVILVLVRELVYYRMVARDRAVFSQALEATFFNLRALMYSLFYYGVFKFCFLNPSTLKCTLCIRGNQLNVIAQRNSLAAFTRGRNLGSMRGSICCYMWLNIHAAWIVSFAIKFSCKLV